MLVLRVVGVGDEVLDREDEDWEDEVEDDCVDVVLEVLLGVVVADTVDGVVGDDEEVEAEDWDGDREVVEVVEGLLLPPPRRPPTALPRPLMTLTDAETHRRSEHP